ncbi:hypothetical protein [Flavobacterium panici]|uniref:Uncharacterized protein n=1 Tax=Flavobacterium panici TaxID=2654843 RepID=A0A9N8J4E1_9FLAO|nr:hypothetical protein [Flavobacterium panici]CAC9975371.1 hypothetical protein FLAPXU55_03084 [Flavobacterium panici]
MQVSKILEILIALGLFYFLFSTLVSLLFEWYSYKTQKRGRFLYETILKLLNDPVNKSYGASLYSHFSIDQLKKNRDSYPQYISSDMFADALIDIIGSQSETTKFENIFDPKGSTNLVDVKLIEDRIEDPYKRFKKGLDQMNYSPLKSHLRALYEKTENYIELKEKITKWFDDYMERVSGWYKTKTKRSLLIISFLVCLALNVDSITLIKKLNTDDKYRKDLVLIAEKKVLENKINAQKIDLEDIVKNIDSIKSIINEIEDDALPIGYHFDAKKSKETKETEKTKEVKETRTEIFLWWLLGIIISAFALSFGAPFWFEVMVKAINIRRAGIKPS